MPNELEKRLKATAKKKHLTGKNFNRYVYGTLIKRGWKPKRGK